MGCSQNAFWVRPSIRLRCLCQKVKKFSTFQAAADPLANQITVMQIQSTHLFDPFLNNKQEKSGCYILFDEMWNDRIVFCHLWFVSSFVFISIHRLCSGKRFDWLQYVSTKTSPLYVRHALGNPSTDACSVNKASW